ncbi:type I-U CRISPR-associated RAMP protein Csb1/Cas7u [Raineyella sp.]|uniref:type I-G CRISPR-associated RAMP protein Csb1/Cas7g n=1 Tax=Raineyella sp. TaxID=1911550 RepID=UPI002B219BE2|nr:type I-U CRISPR-associated RAMP protein Csb1/Cas7u [Raineyella sp.]MEA5153442.1 type I-U CRISPR-associated RAMP protein Csb1/Cas7u [Raineyella sp.]
MTVEFTYDRLAEACSPGGASVLTAVTELAPAAGPHAAVAPARYVSGNQATYAFETRYIDDAPSAVVLIDSKPSQLNRVEQALADAIRDQDPILVRTPRIVVHYPERDLADFEAPHRAFDGHIRAAMVDGKSVTQHPRYRAARDATPGDARALLTLSPVSLVLGAWDSTRRSNQGRYRSALVGEIIGVLADQSGNGTAVPKRGGARRDEIAPSVRVSPDDLDALVTAQEAELSPKNVEALRKAAEKARKGKQGTVSAAALGLGSIPPSLDTLGLVACRRIIRSHVLSFSALRQLRFGGPLEADVACRTLLAALALAALARANEELLLRANCDLVEVSAPEFKLDLRNGRAETIEPLDRGRSDALLTRAIDRAIDVAGIDWTGQVFEVVGNPIVHGGTIAEEEDE